MSPHSNTSTTGVSRHASDWSHHSHHRRHERQLGAGSPRRSIGAATTSSSRDGARRLLTRSPKRIRECIGCRWICRTRQRSLVWPKTFKGFSRPRCSPEECRHFPSRAVGSRRDRHRHIALHHRDQYSGRPTADGGPAAALARQPDSTIITATSGLAFVPCFNYAACCASKAFLHFWLQSLRHHLRANVFLNAATDRRTVATDRVAAPAAPTSRRRVP